MENVSEEFRRSLPGWMISIAIALILLAVSIPLSRLLDSMLISKVSVGLLMRIAVTIVSGVFLVHALSDVLTLGDVAINRVLKFLGIGEERHYRRILKNLACVIAAILAATGIYPLLNNLGSVGITLQTGMMFVTLGIVILFVYDIGRILRRAFRQKVDSIAKRLGITDTEEK